MLNLGLTFGKTVQIGFRVVSSFNNGKMLYQDLYSQITYKNKNLKFLTFVETPLSNSDLCVWENLSLAWILMEEFSWTPFKGFEKLIGKYNVYTFQRFLVIWTAGTVLTVARWMAVFCTWIMLYFKSGHHLGFNIVCTDFCFGNFFFA